MKVYLNKEYKCVKVEDNTFVANDSSNYIRYYFVTNANGDVIDKMDDTSVIYRNTEPSYVTVAFRRADGDVIQHLMASPKTDATGKSFFEYEITNTDGVLYKKGALEISAQFIEATLSETGGVKKVISQKVKAIAINTAHVLDNIGEEAEEYYSQYEQANNDAHAVLQAQITTNFNNIGTLQELTTDVKDDLVKAINEVDAHADANKSEIGNLSNLTTDEKTTIVGAINEVDAHADANKTEIGNLSALTTDEKATLVGAINEVDNHADNATTLANNAVATANGAVATANEAKTTAQTAENNANSAVDKANDAVGKANEAIMKADAKATSIGFMTAKDAVTALNGYPRTQLKGGDTIWIVEDGTPDLWVTEVAQESVPYNYTTKDKFNQDLVDNKVLQIGYFKTAYQESDGKPVTIAWQNVLVKSTDWVASTEFADFPYEAKIELTDFVDYTTVPQVVFDIADTMSGNYAPICKSGDKCVYIYGKVQDEITLKTVITFAPNVNGASVTGGGYNNRGKWVASTTYAIDDLVYTDNGQFVCIEGITSTTPPEQDTQHWQATFVATGKTKNGLKFSGQNTDGSAVQKTFDGSMAVEVAFDEQTMTAKEVNGVLKIGAKGTVPEALPQEASALKSGSLPTSGWTTIGRTLWSGTATFTPSWASIGTYTGNKDDITSIVATIDGENITLPRISQTTDSNQYSDGSKYVALYTSGNEIKIAYYSGSTGVLTNLQANDVSSQTYTISDTDITANSDILMELTDEGGVKSYSMEAGKITIIRDNVPTIAIPYTYKVKQTNTSGQFTLVNHFVPTIPETPTALPQEASALKNGELPTSGWAENDPVPYWDASPSFVALSGGYFKTIGTVKSLGQRTQQNNDAIIVYIAQGDSGTGTYSWETCNYSNTVTVDEKEYKQYYCSSGIYNGGFIRIAADGTITGQGTGSTGFYQSYSIQKIGMSTETTKTYTISDTSITANSDILMELTDDGGVKAYSMEAGKMTVIRDAVPTQPIPYTYKVKQTNASGQFTVLNHYVGVTSVNGQTGAVTIAVPTKTSELENDSGYVRSIIPPVVRNVVCNDVDSAATLDTTITCEVGDLILAQIIVRSVLTLPTGWTLLRTIPAVETSTNQTLSFAYKRATSTSETLTVTQATAGRIYTNLVRLSDAVSISYIQSCEKTGTGIKSILSTKPVTPNMVIWGAASATWNTSSPYGDWTYSPSTLDYYSLPQATRQPRLGTFIDSSGAGERTFTGTSDSSTVIMCGAVEIVGDEVARKGDIPTKTSELTNDSGFITAADIPSAGAWSDIVESATLTEDGLYEFDAVKDNKHYTSLIEIATGISTVGASAYLPVRLSAKKLTSDTVLFQNTAGTITVTHINTEIDLEAASITETRTNISFKYRKIN